MSGTIKIPLFDLDLVNPAELMCHVFAMNWLILDIIDIQLILNKLNLAVPQHSWASPMQHWCHKHFHFLVSDQDF